MSTCGFPQCRQTAGHGGDFHVGPPVEPDNPSRRHMWPKAEARERVLATMGPGPYVGVLTIPSEEDEDAIYRKRAGLDEVVAELRELGHDG